MLKIKERKGMLVYNQMPEESLHGGAEFRTERGNLYRRKFIAAAIEDDGDITALTVNLTLEEQHKLIEVLQREFDKGVLEHDAELRLDDGIPEYAPF